MCSLAVVGANWLGRDASGSARLQEKIDPVRVEIETALGRHTPIIPVLVEGAKMPASSDLPPELADFVYLNAAEVATGRDFRTHMDPVNRCHRRSDGGNWAARAGASAPR